MARLKSVNEGIDKVMLLGQKSMRSVMNPSYWVFDQLGVDLYDNQIEILNAVVDLSVKNLAVLQARGAGKTFSVGVGLAKLCVEHRGMKIGVFAPKAEQATRIIEEITRNVVRPGTLMYTQINWRDSVKSRLLFNNGSEIIAMSAAQTTQQEGWHFHVVVLDECHRIEDAVVNQRINPMLGSFSIAKTIKIGIPAAKNNFWRSCVASRDYTVLKRNWLECDILKMSGQFTYEGIEYPDHIARKLPLSVKQQLFPNRPDLHYEGEYSEFEYKTQFAMEWVADIDLELNEKLQESLVSGTHDILEKGRPELQEHYYFGLDTAGSTLAPGKRDLDYTVLSIWRKRGDTEKEKVACFEWQGDIVNQIIEIRDLIHPVSGKFKCKFGLVDYSNVGITIVHTFQNERIPIDGIMFSQQEKESKKNYKNAMFDEFKFELEHGRIKFPSLATINRDKLFKKSYNEWCNIERHIKTGVNHQIAAPSDLHDDHCSADVLAVWAIDKAATFKTAMSVAYKIPSPKISGASTSVQGRIINDRKEDNRYLK